MQNVWKSNRRSVSVLLSIIALFGFSVAVKAQAIEPGTKPKRSPTLARAQWVVLRAEERVASGRSKERRIEASLLEIQKNLQTQFDAEIKLGVSSESYPEIIKTLQTRRVELKISLAGLEARRKLLVEAMAKHEPSKSTETAFLQQLLSQQQERLAQLQELSANGAVVKAELSQAKVAVTEAKLRLEQARTDTRPDAASQELLLKVSLERADYVARLQKVEELLTDTLKARPALAQRNLILRKLNSLEEQLVRTRDRLVEDEARLIDTRDQMEELEKFGEF